ncbi:tail length tape measure protein [Bordetella phage MW2]|uniref:Tail length tape measure protein n=1 Tax=Bordetella phage MW2 TaxID=1916126 RepID=A0A2D0WBC4_9CAUD|nr:tail length tape measure protein [Bordetella phage MW2]APL99211.1 tail length tape measure protein [Bordetella phage MW2]
MAEERIDIVITERGSRVVKRNLEDIGGSARKSAGGVDFLKNALKGLAAYVSTRELLGLMDTYTNLTNRLRATGLEAQNLTAVYRELLGVANSTRQSFEGTIELYARTAGAAKDLGVSSQELIDFTRSLNQAVALSGASATEAQAAMIQLSQGLAAGALRGEELNSVLEQTPIVADVIAKELGVTRGQLRALGADGKITADIVLNAFKNAREELEERFGKSVPTVSQSFQILRNNLIDLVGGFDQATGVSAALSKALMFMANNLDTIAKLAVSAAAGLALIGGTSSAINMATKAVLALNAAIAANPIGFLLVVLTSVITALTLFRDQIKLGSDEVTTLGDLMRAFGETVGAVFGAIWQWAKDTFGPLVDLIKDWVGEVDISLVGILRFVAKAVDSYYGAWRGAIMAVIELFKSLPAVLGDLMTRALNVLLGKIGDFVNGAGRLLSTVTEFVGLGQIAAVDFKLTNENAGAAAELGKNVGKAFMDGFESTTFAQDFLEDRIKRAQEIGAERLRNQQTGEVDLTGSGSPRNVVDPNAAKEAQKLKDALDALIGSYDKVWAAQQEYAEGEKLLNRAVAAGLITAERRAEVLGLMTAQLRDALDPLGAVNRELDEERRLLGMLSDAREIETQLKAIELDLMNQGVILGAEELEQLRERLRLIQEETRAAQARQSVYDAVIGQQRDFTAQLQAINELTASGAITREQANAFLVQQNSDLLAGTIEAQQAQITATEQMYARIDELRQADLISEQTAQQLKARAQAETNAQRLATAQAFFGNLAVLARSENRELAAIGKAAAVTQATIDGVLAVQKALASAPPPANYALAAAVGVAAAANVAQILAANTNGYAFGGNFEVGGTGGTDSQLVAFRATPGEKVSISTPQQERDREREAARRGNGGGEAGATNVINVLDPALLQDYLTTPEGERVLVNVIRRNRNSIGLR